MIGIYKITSPTNRIYVGQSLDIEVRFNSYKNLYSKISKQPRIYNSIKKYGAENHKFEIIEECEEKLLNERERYWQEFYDVLGRKGLNCRYTKTTDKSGKVSKSTLRKMSLSQKGEKHPRWGVTGKDNPLWGKKHTEETKRKIGKSKIGRKRSEESKNKMRGVNNHNYGLVMSDDQKEKLRLKAIKRYKTNNHPRNKMVIDLYTGIYYSSAKECAMSLNIIYSTFKCKLNRNQNEKRFKYI